MSVDVGVGKTYTALAFIIHARHEGRLGRPVLLVPGSVNSDTPPVDVLGHEAPERLVRAIADGLREHAALRGRGVGAAAVLRCLRAGYAAGT